MRWSETTVVCTHFSSSVTAVAGNAKVGNRINLMTCWQAAEYIANQNLDRRAFEIMNCISVVPGSVGAWRRQAVIEAGGFSDRMLAEDADLTLPILRHGGRVVYAKHAIAYTEAPDTVHGFLKQRSRWMFGTLQAAWKHRDTLFNPKYKALGFFTLPNVFVFQVFFQLVSSLVDLVMILSLVWLGLVMDRPGIGPGGPLEDGLRVLGTLYLIFLAVDFATAALGFVLEPTEDWRLLLWVPLQRFFYRQLLCYVAIKAVLSAIRGGIARWGTIERKATVTLRS